MSEQNVGLYRRLVGAFNARDIEEFVALADQSVEFHSVFAAIGGADYRGHDGIRRYLGDIKDAWGDEFRAEPEAYFDLGEHTLAFGVLVGRGRESRADVALPFAHVVRWREGLCVYFKTYAHREDALGDLCVSEDMLEPIAP